MKVIITERGQGKTSKLIKYCYTNNVVMVCINKNEARRVIQKIKDMTHGGELINSPITHDELLSGRFILPKYAKGVVIDDVDILLNHIFNVPIEMISMTGDIENEQ